MSSQTRENETAARVSQRYDALAAIPFTEGYPSREAIATLKDELIFQRAVQTYLWALPALNIFAMKEGSEKVFGKGYNILPIWKQRLNAKTLVTTPNSDVIYAMGYLDLKEDGPMVIEVPPGLQGILDDFFQRPICSEGLIEGRAWCGDVGLPGPDHGKGGNYLILPPDYSGKPPEGFLTFRSKTNGVFVFWRGFFTDPKRSRAARQGNGADAHLSARQRRAARKRWSFPTDRSCPPTCSIRGDGSAFDMLHRFIESEVGRSRRHGDAWHARLDRDHQGPAVFS